MSNRLASVHMQNLLCPYNEWAVCFNAGEACKWSSSLWTWREDTKMLPFPQLSFKHSHPHPAQTGPIHPLPGAIPMLWPTEFCPAPGSMELPSTQGILTALHQSSNRKSSYWKWFPYQYNHNQVPSGQIQHHASSLLAENRETWDCHYFNRNGKPFPLF